MWSPGFNSILVIVSKICCKESSGNACSTGMVRFSLKHCLIASRASRILFMDTLCLRDLATFAAHNTNTVSDEQLSKRIWFERFWAKSLFWPRRGNLGSRIVLLAAKCRSMSMATTWTLVLKVFHKGHRNELTKMMPNCSNCSLKSLCDLE